MQWAQTTAQAEVAIGSLASHATALLMPPSGPTVSSTVVTFHGLTCRAGKRLSIKGDLFIYNYINIVTVSKSE